MVIEITYQDESIIEYPDFSRWDEIDHVKIIDIQCYYNNLTTLSNLDKCIQLQKLYCWNN